ncbi:hypothetical protein SynA1528_01432 [Synechococcus sp. A15-28]|nr:hypothetical protein SynA1528_01432 [Synechococcus sp. A15-28]
MAVHAALKLVPVLLDDLMPLAAPARAHRSTAGLVDPTAASIDCNHP